MGNEYIQLTWREIHINHIINANFVRKGYTRLIDGSCAGFYQPSLSTSFAENIFRVNSVKDFPPS